MTPSSMVKLIAGVVLGLMILVTGACSMTSVDTGNRGVVTEFGAPVATLDEGLHFINPFTQSVSEMSVRQIKWTNQTTVYTKDVQSANVVFTLTYSLNPQAVLTTYQTMGANWAEQQIPQVAYQVIKDVFGDSEAVADAIQKRGEVQSRIRELLTTALAERSIILHGFEIEDVKFSDEFDEANERKQIAVEDATTAQNRTVQIQEEARQAVIQAQAEADSIRIQAEALARNPALIQYEATKRWNGELPQTMVGDGAVPFIDIQQ